MSLTLARALRIGSSACVAFVGAGGKTTALFQLARQLSGPVIVTATSHLGVWQAQLADQHIIAETPAPVEEIEHSLKGVIVVTGPLDGNRTKPVNERVLQWLRQFCGRHSIPLLIEADGSREKPLKAWANHEPPIPSFVESVVQVVGLTGLGKPLTDKHVHRAEIFAKLSEQRTGESITPDSITRILTHREGGLKNMPTGARRVVLLNQADTPELQSAAKVLAQPLLTVYQAVAIASLKQQGVFAVHEPIAGIILAAGASTRFGQPKQLLDWKGDTFVGTVARRALEAGLSPVIVITGAQAEKVAVSVNDLNVLVVNNDKWQSGQGSSISAGVQALLLRGMDRTGGAIFLLTDQPQVSTSIIRALVEKHAEGLYPIVAPMVSDRRANPVLFDRATFADLSALEGDIGGRAIFHKHRVEYLPWHDDRLLLDVDTPEMYQRLISDDTL